MSMIDFTDYLESLDEEARLIDKATEMEKAIVFAWNNEKFNPKSNLDPKAGIRVCNFLKTKIKSKSKAESLGRTFMKVSDEWAKFWKPKNVPGATQTPKTDILIGNYKLSLKTGKSFQLMSGSKNETLATFYAAIKHLEKENIIEELKKTISQMSEHRLGARPGKIGELLKTGEDEILNKASEINKKIQEKLRNFLNKSLKFKRNFIKEALSGEVKFGGNLGTSSHCLITAREGYPSQLHSLKDENYLDKIANKVQIFVRFKSVSQKKIKEGKKIKTGYYSFSSVLSLIIDKFNEEKSMIGGELLTEENLLGIWDKVKEFFLQLWNKIKEFISESWKNLIDFLELDVEIETSGGPELEVNLWE